jgi:hypothetical protein
MAIDYDTCIQSAQASLNAAREALIAEISDYPTPISGCDAQFNHLLAARQKVLTALSVLDAPVFIPTPRTLVEHSGVESR